MAPPFFFEVTEVQIHPQVPPRSDSSGRWLPPKAQGYNIQKPGSQRIFLCFNRLNAVVSQSIPPDAVHFKTFTVYYDYQTFWMVPYDALTYQVNDGIEDLSGSDSDSSDEDDETNFVDWQLLTFDSAPNDHTFTSYVTCAGPLQQLVLQRTDQSWARRLFPERYHSPNMYTAEQQQYGGLVGELPLLLALIAFSAHPENLVAAFQQCMTGPRWGTHNFSRGRGCES
ncbi:MAG: hypothetical protein M1820_001543 [Bogoriella megaspora]|nr:MAG: hypothetical protein M1820_001543 [Bogoriella megaspora]